MEEVQALTRAAPTLASEGVSLLDGAGRPVRGFMVSLTAPSEQTLSGSGALNAWVWHPSAQLWMRNPDLDLAVSVSDVRAQAWPDLRVGYLVDRRVLFAADGVTVSGGTSVTVRIDLDTSL